MIIVLLANGFEEIEALTPVDILRRAGLDVKTVGVSGVIASGAHGIDVRCDLLPENVDLDKITMAILPGGMPGATNLDASPFTDKVIEAVTKNGGRLAAICAAPLVLGRRGLLDGKGATCYPGFEEELKGAILTDASVVTDGNITTAKGMGAALDFALELVSLTVGKDEANKISKAICSVEKSPARKKVKKAEQPAPEKKLLPVFDDDDVAEMAKRLDATLTRLGVCASIVSAKKGARLTRYKVLPEGKQKASRIIKLTDEIALELAVGNIRIMTLEDDSVCIEIPNKNPDIVHLSDILESEEFAKADSPLSVALGRDFDGTPVIGDLKKMPHMLIAGATGMGKSLVIHSIIRSILSKATSDEVKLILIDPKMVELNMYEGLPHLLMPVLNDVNKSVDALSWAVEEMERRYELMLKADVRNIDAYNEKTAKGATDTDPLPKIVIIVDELADLMLFAKSRSESLILRIAQKARAAGIHLVIASQRPTSSVFTGVIKANIPTRICLKVSARKDSMTVLDMAGAEMLLDRGDALYSPVGSLYPTRIQTPYISNADLNNPAALIK